MRSVFLRALDGWSAAQAHSGRIFLRRLSGESPAPFNLLSEHQMFTVLDFMQPFGFFSSKEIKIITRTDRKPEEKVWNNAAQGTNNNNILD